MDSIDKFVKGGVAYAAAVLYLGAISLWGVIRFSSLKTALRLRTLYVGNSDFNISGRSALVIGSALQIFAFRAIDLITDHFDKTAIDDPARKLAFSVFTEESTLGQMLVASLALCVLADLLVSLIVFGPQNRMLGRIRYSRARAERKAELLRYFFGQNLIFVGLLIMVTGEIVFRQAADTGLAMPDYFDTLINVILFAVGLIAFATLLSRYSTFAQVGQLSKRPRKVSEFVRWATCVLLSSSLLGAFYGSTLIQQNIEESNLFFPRHVYEPAKLVQFACGLSDDGKLHAYTLIQNNNDEWLALSTRQFSVRVWVRDSTKDDDSDGPVPGDPYSVFATGFPVIAPKGVQTFDFISPREASARVAHLVASGGNIRCMLDDAAAFDFQKLDQITRKYEPRLGS